MKWVQPHNVRQIGQRLERERAARHDLEQLTPQKLAEMRARALHYRELAGLPPRR